MIKKKTLECYFLLFLLIVRRIIKIVNCPYSFIFNFTVISAAKNQHITLSRPKRLFHDAQRAAVKALINKYAERVITLMNFERGVSYFTVEVCERNYLGTWRIISTVMFFRVPYLKCTYKTQLIRFCVVCLAVSLACNRA